VHFKNAVPTEEMLDDIKARVKPSIPNHRRTGSRGRRFENGSLQNDYGLIK
jgi:hypothetical protein